MCKNKGQRKLLRKFTMYRLIHISFTDSWASLLGSYRKELVGRDILFNEDKFFIGSVYSPWSIARSTQTFKCSGKGEPASCFTTQHFTILLFFKES